MARLLYQGHGSFRVTSDSGKVAYIDPYAGEGYDKPADLVLISHQHGDHNQLGLITRNAGCTVISNAEALAGGKHNSFEAAGMSVEAVEASNKNHRPDECVGFILRLDGVAAYFSCDTSKTGQMAGFKALGLDYAFLCGDGHYNMGLDEAAECAELIGAKNNVPVHLKPGGLFDRAIAESFTGPNRLIIEAGEEVKLS
ncbi:MAG: MBL fold metallo-hydrolase [Oscillospiraceae bacterium]|nr:MBL fold metallo-hydrolase [Oscillospiraceae bacterium]